MMDHRLPFYASLWGTAASVLSLGAALAYLWYRKVLTRTQAMVGSTVTLAFAIGFMGWASGMAAGAIVKNTALYAAAFGAWCVVYGRAMDIGAQRRAERLAVTATSRPRSEEDPMPPEALAHRKAGIFERAFMIVAVAGVGALWVVFLLEVLRW